MPKRGLGRGLDSLIPDRSETNPPKKNGKTSGKASAKASGKNDGKSAGKSGGKGSAKISAKAGTSKAGSTKAGTKQMKKTPESQTKLQSPDPAPGDHHEGIMGQPADSASNAVTEAEKESPAGQVVYMRLSLVEPNRSQPRKYFDDDAISELADSIRQFGIIQPLLVQKKDGYYEIIAGERRWRAAQKAGLKEVPVIVREFSNQEAVEVALVENIQREDLNPIEEAKAYERLVEEYGLSQEEVAGRVSKSRSAVTNSMRLLRLEEPVQKMVETSQISEGHARALLGLSSPDDQLKAANEIVKEHLSVRQTEKLVRDANRPKKTAAGTARKSRGNAMLEGLSENLKTVLGTKVSIRPSGKNSGRIEIEYYSEDELDRIYELLLGAKE